MNWSVFWAAVGAIATVVGVIITIIKRDKIIEHLTIREIHTPKEHPENKLVKRFDIKVEEAYCYLEVADSKHPRNPFRRCYEWSKLLPHVFHVPEKPERYLKVLLIVHNRDEEPIFVKGLSCDIVRGKCEFFANRLEDTYTIPSYPDKSLRLRTYPDGKAISLNPWFEVKIGDKLIWELFIDLGTHNPEYYLEYVRIYIATDKDDVIEKIISFRKSVGWKSLVDEEKEFLEEVFSS